MGTGNGSGMEPYIGFCRLMEGEIFILCITGAKPYPETVNYTVFYLGCLGFFIRFSRFFPLSLLSINTQILQLFL